MIYLILTIIFFISLVLYFRIADYFNIIDKPNHRSSHDSVTLRGGGIILWIAALFYFVLDNRNSSLFFIGITLISIVSFWDDIQSLPNTVRILAHLLAISLIFYQLEIYNTLSIWEIVISYVVAIGVINAYNFMDGINGITGLYTMVVMGSFLFVNKFIHHFVDMDMIIYPILASAVFLFFNFRKRAKCFAGDVGSISIAFWIIFLLVKIMLVTGTIVWILFLAVYGIDTVCTIIHRLYIGQNIFLAHRMHLYQVLSNECKMDHRLVSSLYATTQAVVSVVVINWYDKATTLTIFISVLLPLLLIYPVKFYLTTRRNNVVHETVAN
jgi:UDP-N-acetylmuramyl pentapeptide phosphotransferase/UDP-N-acetylglucosamine-1-phosphate transferase